MAEQAAVQTKVPEPNQYWEHVKSQDRAYFIGRTPEGQMVWQIDGDTVEVGNLDWSGWRHIPGCTGWDWEPADRWPKYYVNRDPGLKWYVRAENHRELPDVYLPDGSACTSQANWHEIDDSLSRGVWVEVTEAEARARIAVPAEPRIEVQFLPVAPEMDWVVQDRVPARNNIDEWCWCRADRKPKTFQHGFAGWSSRIMHGHRMGDEVLHLRCRRKDLPVVESPEDWVELPGNHALRPGIDQVAVHSPDNWVTFYESVTSWIPCACRCRRKDLPNIESPEDWVTQDRVDARPGIDQGWWSYAEPNVDKSKWSWWPIANSGSAIGRKHGHVHEDGQMLNLRCKRKDLPPVPVPVEETFPQWYILKESEIRSWVPRWAIKRTCEDTCFRYVMDGVEVLQSREPWTGGCEAWECCTATEAYDRLGTGILHPVPSEPRRVPVKLWVTYRLNDEGGDWPVRATQADQTCQNWKEIKFDGNGAFIEVAG